MSFGLGIGGAPIGDESIGGPALPVPPSGPDRTLTANQQIPNFNPSYWETAGYAASRDSSPEVSCDLWAQSIPGYASSEFTPDGSGGGICRAYDNFDIIAIDSTVFSGSPEGTIESIVKASADQTIPDFPNTTSGTLTSTAQADQTIPDFTQVATIGGIRQIEHTQLIADFASVATATAIASLAADQAIPDFDSLVEGDVDVELSGDYLIPDFGSTATAVVKVAADHAITMADFTQSVTAEVKLVAQATQTIPDFTNATTGGPVAKLQANQTIPAFPQVAGASPSIIQQDHWMMLMFG